MSISLRPRSTLTALLALLLVPALLVACGGDDDADGAGSASPDAGDDQQNTPVEVGGDDQPKYLGVKISPPLEKPDYVLTDTSGEPFDIRQETQGKLTLLYLGYTNCPDICPTHMADVAAALRQLDPDIAEQVEVLFVTTDPARDTPEVIRRWLDAFNEDFVGLTGDPQELIQLQREMGMNPAEKVQTGEGEDQYEVNHGAYVIAFTPQDDVAYTVYPFGVSTDIWVNDLTKLITEGYQPDQSG